MKYGDIVQLGQHRLMCGDATKREDVDKLIDGYKVDLILTDPPYGMKVQDKHGCISYCVNRPLKRAYDKRFANTILSSHEPPIMAGDESSATAYKHYEIIKNLTPHIIIWGGQYFADFLPVNGGWIFWDKRTGKNNFSDGELAWRSWGKKVYKYEQLWNGVFMKCNYVLNGRGSTKGSMARLHPTQKPVELFANILEDFTKPDDVILDCFGGSGTTLIACEVTGRTCLMMELSPEYCNIIIQRYEELKGLFIS